MNEIYGPGSQIKSLFQFLDDDDEDDEYMNEI